jgi:hypothetical protein
MGQWRHSSTILVLCIRVELSASRPCWFTHRKKVPCGHWIGRRVCLRAGLDYAEKRKMFLVRAGNRSLSLYQFCYSGSCYIRLYIFLLLVLKGFTEICVIKWSKMDTPIGFDAAVEVTVDWNRFALLMRSRACAVVFGRFHLLSTIAINVTGV